MSKEEMLKHTTGRARAALDSLTNQAGVDAWELALERFPKMRQLDAQQQAWTVESWLDIMAENKMALTWDSALNAAKFLGCSPAAMSTSWLLSKNLAACTASSIVTAMRFSAMMSITLSTVHACCCASNSRIFGNFSSASSQASTPA